MAFTKSQKELESLVKQYGLTRILDELAAVAYERSLDLKQAGKTGAAAAWDDVAKDIAKTVPRVDGAMANVAPRKD